MRVSKKFIKEQVEGFYGFGGQINKDDIVKGDFKMLDSTLNANTIIQVKEGNCNFKSFLILVDGHGWGTAYLYEDGAKAAEELMHGELMQEE